MTYAGARDGKPLIISSALGLAAREAELTVGFSVTDVRRTFADGEWPLPWGENRQSLISGVLMVYKPDM